MLIVADLLAILLILVAPALAFYLIWVVIGFRGFLSVFALRYSDSWLMKLDPRVKLLLAIVLPALASGLRFWESFVLLLGVLFLYLFAPDPLSKYRFMIPLILAIELPSAWLIALSFRGFFKAYSIAFPAALRAFGVSGISLSALLFGLEINVRTSLALASSFLLIFTCSPSDLLRSLTKSKIPVEIGFALAIALTAIPKVMESISVTLEAVMSRGLSLKAKPSSAAYPYFFAKALFLAVANVVILTIKDAEEFATSADLRGFRSFKRRTYYHDFRLGSIDWALIVVLLSLWGISIYYFG